MAEGSGGARLDLSRAPVKYAGLAPWEVLISEAQERMTLAVAPEKIDRLLELARKRGGFRDPNGLLESGGVLGSFTVNRRIPTSKQHTTQGEMDCSRKGPEHRSGVHSNRRGVQGMYLIAANSSLDTLQRA